MANEQNRVKLGSIAMYKSNGNLFLGDDPGVFYDPGDGHPDRIGLVIVLSEGQELHMRICKVKGFLAEIKVIRRKQWLDRFLDRLLRYF